MRPGFHSRTAEVTAAIRASHFLHDSSLVFSDPLAIELTNPAWRLVCRNKLLHWLIIRKKFGHLRPIHSWILARSRIAEHKLEAFVKAGGTQFVQLGAGFDSVALRNPEWLKNVRIFELDHPETQSLKRERIKRNKYSLPECLELVPIDFEEETVDDCLKRTSFDCSAPTFFS